MQRNRALRSELVALRRSCDELAAWAVRHGDVAPPELGVEAGGLLDAIERVSRALVRRPAVGVLGALGGVAAAVGAAAGDPAHDPRLSVGEGSVRVSAIVHPEGAFVLRVSEACSAPDPDYPVGLTLLGEMELALLFCTKAGAAPPDAAGIERQLMACEARPPRREGRVLPPPRRCARRLTRELSRLITARPAMAALLPYKARIGAILTRGDATTRTMALSLLWNGEPSLTTLFEAFETTLDALDHAHHVWAPRGLLDAGPIGQFAVPGEQGEAVTLRLPSGGMACVARAALDALCAEVTLAPETKGGRWLCDHDLLVFPSQDPAPGAKPRMSAERLHAQLVGLKRVQLLKRAVGRRELCALIDARGHRRPPSLPPAFGSPDTAAWPALDRETAPIPVFPVLCGGDLHPANGRPGESGHPAGLHWLGTLPQPGPRHGAVGRLEKAVFEACRGPRRLQAFEREILRLRQGVSRLMKTCARRDPETEDRAARRAGGQAMLRRLRPCIEERRVNLLIEAVGVQPSDLRRGVPPAVCVASQGFDIHARFADAVLNAWRMAAQRRLGRADLLRYLGMIPAHAELLVTELAEGARRTGLGEAIARMSQELALQQGAPDRIAGFAPHRAAAMVNGFVAHPHGRAPVTCDRRARWHGAPLVPGMAGDAVPTAPDPRAVGRDWSAALQTLIAGNAESVAGQPADLSDAEVALEHLLGARLR